MQHPKEMSAKKPKKPKCKVVGCANDALTDSKKMGCCKFHFETIFKPKKQVQEHIVEFNKMIAKAKEPKRQSNKSKVIRKLDSVFSVYIRLRDTDENGNGKCISNDIPIYYFVDNNGNIKTNCDNGHYHQRGIMAVRYDEINCNAQDRIVNQKKEGNKVGYQLGLIKKYGQSEYDKLLARKNTSRQYKEFELIKLIEFYENRITELLEEKNWWSEQRSQKSLYY